jgi:hypothetical protein
VLSCAAAPKPSVSSTPLLKFQVRSVRRSVERGEQVSRGQLLCEIAIDDRAMAVEEAQGSVKQSGN